MEVLVGPTFSIEVPAPPAYVRDRSGVPAKDKVVAAASPCLFAKDEEEEGGPGLHLGMSENSPEDSSDSSSSIGSPDGSEEEDDAVSSEGDGLGLRSLGSLEDSLPIKRGLSNHYTGKSKSFGNLADVSTVKELKKPENPFNKRRRVLIASKLSRRSSFYSWQNPKSMPLLALPEEEEDEVNPEDNNGDQQHNPEAAAAAKPKLQERNNKNLLKASRFKSQSCFSLTDLQDEDQ